MSGGRGAAARLKAETQESSKGGEREPRGD